MMFHQLGNFELQLGGVDTELAKAKKYKMTKREVVAKNLRELGKNVILASMFAKFIDKKLGYKPVFILSSVGCGLYFVSFILGVSDE